MAILTCKPQPDSLPAALIYRAATLASRRRIFYESWGTPDTPQGRFEMLALHLALVLTCLKSGRAGQPEKQNGLMQNLCDWIVADIEESLRAMRISDSKIPGQLKKFVEGFYGRLVAYDEALEVQDQVMLEKAICRNVYGREDSGTTNQARQMAACFYQEFKRMKDLDILQITDFYGRE